jgi:Tfp pilus assembly protein PilN
MTPLWIDYQRGDPARRRPGLLLLAVGIVATLLTTADYLAVAAERDDAQSQVEGLRRTAERERPTNRTASAPATAPAAAAETPTAAPSAQRWDALFAALEAAANDTVTLLTLHPTGKEIQLSGEAKDFASSMDYVQRLQAQPVLANARLTQSEVMTDNPHRPVRFSLVADWRGAQ